MLFEKGLECRVRVQVIRLFQERGVVLQHAADIRGQLPEQLLEPVPGEIRALGIIRRSWVFGWLSRSWLTSFAEDWPYFLLFLLAARLSGQGAWNENREDEGQNRNVSHAPLITDRSGEG
jgi:hypothetical protein